MRVLYWSTLFWPYIGGVETFCAQLGSAVSQRGYEILVLTSHDDLKLPDAETFKGMRIRRLPFLEASSKDRLDLLLKVKHKAAQLKREFEPTLIHVNSHFGVADAFHALTSDVCPAPTVVTLHNQWTELGNSTVARVMKNSDWVVCVSRASLAQARQVLPEIADRSSVIYNGLELPTMNPSPLPWKPPRLLCLGRLSREKGFDLALTAFATISKCFATARMMIAGDGPERNALEFQSARLGLSSKVNFLGWVSPDGVPALINSATIVILPSRSEGLGLVALEAAMMGRPVIAARVGGLPEVVLDGLTGILVEKENSQATAGAILDLLGHPQTALRMGRAARSRAIQVFGWDRFVNAYDKLYQSLTTPEKINLREATDAHGSRSNHKGI